MMRYMMKMNKNTFIPRHAEIHCNEEHEVI
jgi:hypothetical protein